MPRADATILSEPTPKSSPLAFLPLNVGETPGMSYKEVSRLMAQNAGAWLMILFGSLFVVLNALQGTIDLVGINFAFISVGATSLWLSAAGFRRTSMVFLSTGASLVFFYGAVVFRNGMENYLLVTMAASLLLMDSPGTRMAFTGVNAAGYLFAKLSLPPEGAEALANARYALNIGLFVFALAGIIEFFRVLNSDYLRTLEKANSDLAASNLAKERLFSVIAHDLRGPVGNLKVSLDMLEGGSLAPEEFSSLVSDLAFDVDKSYTCLENLLSWSATQLGGMTANASDVSLREEIDEVARLSSFAISGKNLRFENAIPPEACARVDKQHLHAIARNLLSNAVKFTPPGGEIRVSAEKGEKTWTFVVSDSGIGMPTERAEAVFASHEVSSTPGTDAERGLGLGLEICRQFIALNGGTISGESAPGVGTRIYVTLPEANGALPDAVMAAARSQPAIA